MIRLAIYALLALCLFLSACLLHSRCSRRKEGSRYNRTIERMDRNHRQRVGKLEKTNQRLHDQVRRETAKRGVPLPDTAYVQTVALPAIERPETPVHVRHQLRPDTALRKGRERQEILLLIEKKKRTPLLPQSTRRAAFKPGTLTRAVCAAATR